jgi:serine/threonine protein kinase
MNELSAELREIRENFEQEWLHAKNPPDLDAFIGGVAPGQRRDLFAVLLPIDVQFRRRFDLRPMAADYARFVDYGDVVENVFAPADTVGFPEQFSVTTDFEQPVLAEPTEDPADHPSTESTTRQQIGRYTVLQQLGSGGQGAVYRAAHPTLPIEVALKVGKHALNHRLQAALVAEAHVLCDLEHPNIARIRDLDFDEGGCPILVLDLVRGRSLQSILAEGDVDQQRALGWVLEVAEAVAYAHRRGVLHLDLKPGNIVVTETDQAKVIDFGLARLRDAWSDPEAEVDEVSGTPNYMAPEQARGIAADIGSKADVFALGAVMFRLLTGTTPYAGDSHSHTLHRAACGEVNLEPLESHRVSPELAAICARALAPDPSERFSSVDELAHAIRDAVSATSHSQIDTVSPIPVPRQTTHFLVGGLVTVMSILFISLAFDWEETLPTGLNSSASSERRIPLGADGTESLSAANDRVVVSSELPDALLQSFAVTASRDQGPLRPVDELAPLRNGDHLHFSVQLREPAFVRLIWIDSHGEPTELFPNDPEVGFRGDGRIQAFESPSDPNRGWPLLGEQGTETALLLVSRESLSEIELSELQAKFPAHGNVTSVGYFRATADRPAAIRARPSNQRSLGKQSTAVGWTPVLRLLDRVRSRVEVADAVTIPHHP